MTLASTYWQWSPHIWFFFQSRCGPFYKTMSDLVYFLFVFAFLKKCFWGIFPINFFHTHKISYLRSGFICRTNWLNDVETASWRNCDFRVPVGFGMCYASMSFPAIYSLLALFCSLHDLLQFDHHFLRDLYACHLLQYLLFVTDLHVPIHLSSCSD